MDTTVGRRTGHLPTNRHTPLRGSVALVTGASRGLGAELAQQLSRAGAAVAVTGRDESALTRVERAILGSGGECLALPGDISSHADVARCVEAVVARFGRVDTLINNAAICRYGPLESMPVEQLEQLVDVNLKGSILASRAVIPLLRAQRRGDIVNIASGSALSGMPNLAVYSATKAALIGFSRSLASELASEQVRVFCPCPGWMDTDMLGAFPESQLPARADMLSTPFVAALIVGLLLEPRRPRGSPLSRLVAGLARRFRRDPFPVFRFI